MEKLNDTKIRTKKQLFPLLVLSFIEGGTLMAVEIVSAKIISPFYGNSLYVWSAVLGTTLLGLAAGYFWGGNLSLKPNATHRLLLVSLIAAILVLLFPFTSPFLLKSTLGLGIEFGVTIATLLLLFPTMLCFGMVSPFIIGIISQNGGTPGKNAATIYALSTLGGIIFALTTGLYLITQIGIKNTCLLTGSLFLITVILTGIPIKKQTT